MRQTWWNDGGWPGRCASVSAVHYVPALTGIRALAALLVLGLHTDQNVPADIPSVLPFLLRGHLGVDFFFLLSGFIITHVYLNGLALGGRGAVGIYLWHRFARLYPLHVAVLLGLVIAVGAASAAGIRLNSETGWSGADIVWNLLLVHAWGLADTATWNAPSWSISAEWFAYLLFPLMVPLLRRLHAPAVPLLLAVVALVITERVFAAAGWSLNSVAGAPALARVSGEFLCGALLCRAVSTGLAASLPSRSGDVVAVTAFATFLLGASTGMGDFALTGLLAMTITGVAVSNGIVARALGSRPMVWLGEISYAVYMVHFPVLIVLRRPLERLGFAEWSDAGKVLAYAGAVVLVIIVAASIHAVIEQPARHKLRDRMGLMLAA